MANPIMAIGMEGMAFRQGAIVSREGTPGKRPKPYGHWISPRGYKGFTLIELVVTLVLLGIVAVLATRVLSTSLDMWITTEDYARERADQVATLERMVREVRQAESINTCDDSILSLDREDGRTLKFKARDGNLLLDGEPLCHWESGPKLCECVSHDLVHLTLSEGNSAPEVSTHVYPRKPNANCP